MKLLISLYILVALAAVGAVLAIGMTQNLNAGSDTVREISPVKEKYVTKEIKPDVAGVVEPRPSFVDVMWGEKISMQEAEQWAKASGFRIAIPQSLPAGYVIKEVRTGGKFPSGPEPGAPLRVGSVMLVFAPKHITDEIRPSKFKEVGVIILQLSKAQPDFENLTRTQLEADRIRG